MGTRRDAYQLSGICEFTNVFVSSLSVRGGNRESVAESCVFSRSTDREPHNMIG